MIVEEIPVADTYDLRRRVLRSHRPGLPLHNPEDDVPGTFSLGVRHSPGGALAGVGTFSPAPTPHRPGRRAARLRGMAVEPAAQGRGVGRALLGAATDRLVAQGFAVLWCNARDTALRFYAGGGFVVVGGGFVEHGLPHHAMVLDLVPSPPSPHRGR